MKLAEIMKMRPYKKQVRAINNPAEEVVPQPRDPEGLEVDEFGQPISPIPSDPNPQPNDDEPNATSLDPATILRRKKTRAVLDGLKGTV